MISLERIVVVALATILAAALIVGLAGYVDKAENGRYTFEARAHIIAVRAVLNESLAHDSSSSLSSYGATNHVGPTYRSWQLAQLSEIMTGDRALFRERAVELLRGVPAPPYATTDEATSSAASGSSSDPSSGPSSGPSSDSSDTSAASVVSDNWEMWLIAPPSVSSPWNADAFLYLAWSEGSASMGDVQIVYVSYQMSRVNVMNAEEFLTVFWEQASYDSDAGYEVYRFDSDPSFVPAAIASLNPGFSPLFPAFPAALSSRA
jgi:hypothetical protein